MPLPATEEQRARVSELQEELNSRGVSMPPGMVTCGRPEATLLRFLKARKLDVEQAADMIVASIAWREEMKADESLTTFLDEETEASLRQCIPAGYIGFTKEGNPLRLEYTTKINIADMMKRGVSDKDYIFYHMREMEYLMHVQFPEAAELYGKEVIDAQSVILDLSGVSVRMLNSTFFSVFTQISKMYQDNYPETMSTMFLVNIPSFFHAIWRLISSSIDERIRQKIFFLRSRDLAVLKDFVTEEYLPISLGGINPGEDGRYVNESDGYIQPVHRAMQREISVRQLASQDEDDDDDTDYDEVTGGVAGETHGCSTRSKDGSFSRQRAPAAGSFASDSADLDDLDDGTDDGSPTALYVGDSPDSAGPTKKSRRVKKRRWAPRKWFKRQPPYRVTVDALDQPDSRVARPRDKSLGRFFCMRPPRAAAGGDEILYLDRHNDFYKTGPKAQSCRDMGIGLAQNITSISQHSVANTVGAPSVSGSEDNGSMRGSSRAFRLSRLGVAADNGLEGSQHGRNSPVVSDAGSSLTPLPLSRVPESPLGTTPQKAELEAPGISGGSVPQGQKEALRLGNVFSPQVLIVALLAIITSLVALTLSTGSGPSIFSAPEG